MGFDIRISRSKANFDLLLAYTDKLNGFSDEQLIQRIEALNAKIQELKDCYSVERLSRVSKVGYIHQLSHILVVKLNGQIYY